MLQENAGCINQRKSNANLPVGSVEFFLVLFNYLIGFHDSYINSKIDELLIGTNRCFENWAMPEYYGGSIEL